MNDGDTSAAPRVFLASLIGFPGLPERLMMYGRPDGPPQTRHDAHGAGFEEWRQTEALIWESSRDRHAARANRSSRAGGPASAIAASVGRARRRLQLGAG